MKISVVPAQITTVEDRIAGNLNFTQILLLSVPQFFSAFLFLIIPPIGHFSILKLVVALIIIACSSILALRIKDKILMDIIKTRLIYFFRPHIYVYRKTIKEDTIDYETSLFKPKKTRTRKVLSPEINELLVKQSYKLLENVNYSVRFKAKQGGLHVEVTNYE